MTCSSGSKLFIWLIIALAHDCMPKRSLRERVAEEPSAASSECVDRAARGGIRQRVKLEPSETKHDSPRGGIVARVSETLPNDECDKPLNKRLRLKWAEGKLNAEDVLGVATDASQQGALGLGKLARAATTPPNMRIGTLFGLWADPQMHPR